MSEERPERESVREAARRARAEARRLRDEARSLDRRLRDEARRERAARRESEHRAEAASGEAARETFSLQGVTAVSLQQSAGQVLVRLCGPGEEPGVETTAGRTAPALSVRIEGSTLLIEIHVTAGFLFRRRRGATTTLRLAPGPDSLRVNLGAGDIQLREISAPELRLSTGAGLVNAVGSTGALSARVGAGKITVLSHHGTVQGRTGTGDATVDVAEAPPGTYEVDTGIGRAELRLPPGLAVHARVRSGLGRGRADYPDAGADAPVLATVSSGIGEAALRAREGEGERARAGDGPAPAEPSTPRPVPPTRQAEELRILHLLEQGRITVAEAGDLIAALHGSPRNGAP